MTNKKGWTALMIAAKYHNRGSSQECMRLLLEKGAEIDKANNKGWTALTLLAKECNKPGAIECIKLLIEYGATNNIPNHHGKTAQMLVKKKLSKKDYKSIKVLFNTPQERISKKPKIYSKRLGYDPL